jgi:hypothetical protein
LPNGDKIIRLTLKETSFPCFTVNSASAISNAIDFAVLAPIVQPLLDGAQAPIPQNLQPHSPLLHSAPLLKMYTSIRGNSKFVSLLSTETNERLFPPIECVGVSRYGLVFVDMEMNLHSPEVVLDVAEPSEAQRSSAVWGFISDCLNYAVFGRAS